MTFPDETIYESMTKNLKIYCTMNKVSPLGHKKRQITDLVPTLLLSAATLFKVKPSFDVTTSSHCGQLSGSQRRFSKLSSLSATTQLVDLRSPSTVLGQNCAGE